ESIQARIARHALENSPQTEETERPGGDEDVEPYPRRRGHDDGKQHAKQEDLRELDRAIRAGAGRHRGCERHAPEPSDEDGEQHQVPSWMIRARPSRVPM